MSMTVVLLCPCSHTKTVHTKVKYISLFWLSLKSYKKVFITCAFRVNFTSINEVHRLLTPLECKFTTMRIDPATDGFLVCL